MITRPFILVGLLLAVIMAKPAGAEQAAGVDTKKAQAIQLLLHGKAKQAVRVQQELIAAEHSPFDKALLQRDLMEMCATAEDWQCVNDTVQDLLRAVKSDPRLAVLAYDVMAYAVKLSLWHQDFSEVETFLRQGGPLAAPDPSANPPAVAELELALHDYYVRKDDLKDAEKSLATAIEALLLTDRYGKYRQAELAVGLLQALLHAQDIVGAAALADRLQPLMSRLVFSDSVIAARYQMLYAHLTAYTGNYALTVAAFEKAARAVEQLDIDQDSKTYDLSVANSLATAALILSGRNADAAALHARHPLQAQKGAILGRGEFRTVQEFYFAVSDVFVNAAVNGQSDARWKPLFETPSRWNYSGVEAVDLESYRSFALGLLARTAGDLPGAARLLRLAAQQRIDAFDTVLRAHFEGFPLPSLLDRIVVGLGLTSAQGSDAREDIDLMLRGSEMLGRSLRHELADVAVLLGSQPDAGARRSAQAYVRLLRQKRDWELDRVVALLARDGAWDDRDELVRTHADMARTLADLKERLARDQRLVRANGLPHLDDLQRNMPPDGAFVTYFGGFTGVSKLCVTRDRAVNATGLSSPDVIAHARLMQFATTASYPPNATLDAQFPVASALYLYRFYFGGLESCLRPGMQVTMAVPFNFAAGVAFGALLAEAPPRAGNGYDLAKAHWLIRDYGFSLVVSARQYLATIADLGRPPAPRPYLGVGDPKLDKPQVASAAAPNRLADFGELPETADELKAVGALFGAPATDIMTGDGATAAALRAKPLGDYDVLHFATHGLVKQDLPGLTQSALVLTPSGDGDATDGLLSAADIAGLPLNARLVVLSACNTAKYDLAQATLGVQDLQAAFTAAGAPTLLASLWPIDSPTARELVLRFFKEWRAPDTRGAADALARATRAYLAKADAPHQHPRFWAPFVVVGNGAVRGVTAQAPAPPDGATGRH